MHVLGTSVYDLSQDLKARYLGVLFMSYGKLELGVNRRLAVSALPALNRTAVVSRAGRQSSGFTPMSTFQPTHPVMGFGR